MAAKSRLAPGIIKLPLIHAEEVFHAVFSPDGRRLATLTIGGGVRLWSTDTGEPITSPIPHPYEHQRGRLQFSPDGRRLLIATGGSEVYLREFLPEQASVTELLLQAQILSGQTLDDSVAATTFNASSLKKAWEQMHAQRMGR